MSTTIHAPTDGLSQSSHSGFELPAHELQELLRTSPIDIDQLRKQCLNDLNFALMMLDEFQKTSRSRLDAFDAALATHDHAAIRFKAHALKGVASILAANATVEICKDLESAAAHADWNLLRDLTQQLHHEMQRTIIFIPRIRSVWPV